jgi:RHS repeat-associated protein
MRGAASSGSDNGVGNGGMPGNGNGNDNGNGNSNGHDATTPLPVLVSGVDNVVQVAAGGWSSYALRSDGTAWSWGDDSYGELGLGDPPNVKDVDAPTQIVGLPAVKMLAAGGVHAAALTTRGQVYAWGDDNAGQVGTPTADCRQADKVCPAPQLVDGMTADAIAAGYVHTLIATVHETVLGLGRDAEGELGDGYADPATQVSAAGDRNGQGAPASGAGSAKAVPTPVTGLAHIRPQAPITATYTYTGDGLRASATTTVNDTTTMVPATTRSTFTWDTTTAVPTVICDGTNDYINGPAGLIEQTGALDGSDTGGTLFVHGDRIGSTRLLTNTSGHPVATFDYTPTGQTTQADGLNLLPYAQGIPPAQPRTPIGYAGAYTDPGTGWQYLRARYNDPTTNQFLSLDPAVTTTGQPYAYAADNPVNNTDPTGLKCRGIFGCAGHFVASTAATDWNFYTNAAAKCGMEQGTSEGWTSPDSCVGHLSGAHNVTTGVHQLTHGCPQAGMQNIELGSVQMASLLAAPELTPDVAVLDSTTELDADLSTFAAEKANSVADDLAAAQSHLGSIPDALDYPPNKAMLDSIRSAGAVGESLTTAQRTFLDHELLEAQLMRAGLSQEEAHQAVLAVYPPGSNYSPEVIKEYSGYFSDTYFKYWGIDR